MGKLCSISTRISNWAAIIGISCFFIGIHAITVICAVITLVNSIIQVAVGDQNNFRTESLTIFVGLIVALIFKLEIVPCIALSLCIGELLFWVLGHVMLAVKIAQFYRESKKYQKAHSPKAKVYPAQSRPSANEQLKEAHPELIDYAKQLKWLFDREEKLKGTIAELQKQLSIVQDRASIEQQLAEETQKLAKTRKDIKDLQNIIRKIRNNFQKEFTGIRK